MTVFDVMDSEKISLEDYDSKYGLNIFGSSKDDELYTLISDCQNQKSLAVIYTIIQFNSNSWSAFLPHE
jgi:hypothetical protein